MSQSSTSSTGRSFPTIRGRHPVFYCLLLLSIPLAAMFASLFVLRTDWFPPRAGNTYIATIGYGAKLRNASCDVLINGDSSALVGVVPETITQQTGLSACNISEFGGMEQVNGRMILETYLKNNARPRFLIFLYAPENLSPRDKWTSVSHFEGILYRLRTHPDAALVGTLLLQAKELFAFWTLGMRLAVQAFITPPLAEEVQRARETHGGWLAVPGSILTKCQTNVVLESPDADYANALRRQYGVGGTKVLVDVTPEPECEPHYDFYAARLPGVIDNSQQKYPLNLYNDSGRLHLIRSGAERFSAEIAAQISAPVTSPVDTSGKPH